MRNWTKAERQTSISRLSAAIQKTISDARPAVEWLIELGMVEGIGNGSARRYMLSVKVYSITNNKSGLHSAAWLGYDTGA